MAQPTRTRKRASHNGAAPAAVVPAQSDLASNGDDALAMIPAPESALEPVQRPKARTRPPRAARRAAGKQRARTAGSKSPRATKRRSRTRAPLEGAAPEMLDVETELEEHPEIQHRNQALTEELIHEFEVLVKRLMRLSPAYKTDLTAPAGVAEAVGEHLEKLSPEIGGGLLKRLQKMLPGDMLDLDTWKGMWTMLKFAGQYQLDVAKRRVKGEYETDEWGKDPEFVEAVLPFFSFLYNKYWRVELSGMENVPESGCGLLVSNHSGQLPFDGAMIATGLLQHHPTARELRALYATWFPTLPFVSDILVKTGQVLGNDDNAQRLLEQEHLVAVFPEGYKGVGKLYKDRYHLARFGRGGFVRVALKTKAPLIPVAVVGAEETYISLHKSPTLAKLIGFPYFPISPTWPWLGPLGLIPLPTKWYIDVGEPIRTDQYPDGSDQNLMLISQLTDQIRETIQRMLYDRLAQRKSVFMG